MTERESLELNFREILELPEPAIDWLLMLWNFIQVLDDVADKDPVSRSNLDAAIWDSLVGIPANPFYAQFSGWLVPACAQMVMKWQASDIAERAGVADERSYMWRAGYYDIVCLVVALVHGPDVQKSYAALSLYGEGCAEYMKEFEHA